MIHVARLGVDASGRSIVDSRVLDVDAEDGLDQASRVNSAIDVIRTATTDAHTPSICVAVRFGDESTDLHKGTGRRRRVRVVDEDVATVRYLANTGLLSTYDSVLVIDCGDSGMTLFRTSSESAEVVDVVRTADLSGRELDRRIAATVGARHGWPKRPTEEQIAACRTAKEELFSSEARLPSGQVRVTEDDVEHAVRPLIDLAAQQVSQYLRRCVDTRPQAVLVVGGLANVPHVVEGLERAAGVAAVGVSSPELAGALGAALIARETDSGITRLVTIGGRRNRDWLSTAPLVVAGAAIGVIAMSVYASGALSSHESPFVPATPSAPNVSDVSILTTRTTVDNGYDPGEATLTPDTPDQGPGWATTRLNPSTSARTRTLVPTTLPTDPRTESTSPTASATSSTTTTPRIPFVPSGIPLPTNLIPSGLIPSPSPAPQPENAPRGSEQGTTTTPKSSPKPSAPRSNPARHPGAHPTTPTPYTPPPPVVPQR